jgi:hypothetical protein
VLKFESRPNPTRGETVISLELQSSARLTLEIHDIAGRRVASIWRQEELAAGTRRVAFEHRALPAGMYLMRLRVGRETIERKLFVLK